jgi:transposase
VRKVREVLRLKAAGLSDRQIAGSVGSSRSAVQECLRRAREAGLSWPLAEGLDETALHARLYRRSVPLPGRPEPDFAQVHRELGRRGVTRLLLWQEYKAAHPDGWQYSAFCARYERWRATQTAVLRQHHAPGEKLFVDYAGHTIPIHDRHGGPLRQAQIFVAVLGCSNYTYAEATDTQQLPDWLGAHVRAFAYFGGVPAAVVPDNLRPAVTRAHRYEPVLNPSYQDLAEHYQIAVLPARVRKPRDKAKVETGVLIVERWILARLRHRTFFSLGELNTAIRALLEDLNTRPFKKLEGCRRSRFLALEQQALKPLPARPYEYAFWRRAKVHPDYHIEVIRAYYSVPYALISTQVDVRVGAHAVEVFHQGTRVAIHPRLHRRGQRSTLPEHRPAGHAAVIERSLARLLERAAAIGPATAEVLRRQAAHRKHPEETFRSAQGILRLAQDFSGAELESACERALVLQAYSCRIVRTLIQTPPAAVPTPMLDLAHDNLRGPEYFQ